MANWAVKLKGETAFLQKLADEYPTPDFLIAFDQDGFSLKSDTFIQPDDKADVSAMAECRKDVFYMATSMIEFINSASRVYSNRNSAVNIEGFWIFEED